MSEQNQPISPPVGSATPTNGASTETKQPADTRTQQQDQQQQVAGGGNNNSPGSPTNPNAPNALDPTLVSSGTEPSWSDTTVQLAQRMTPKQPVGDNVFKAVRSQWRGTKTNEAPVLTLPHPSQCLTDEDVWDRLEDPPEQMDPPVQLSQLLGVLVEKWDDDGLYD
jgi:hypothetical protein